jgi:hypothetical protein
MAKVKLSATLPKDDTEDNGLDALHKDLTTRPTATYFVVGTVTAAKTVVDHDRGNARQPEVRFVTIEAVLNGSDRAEIERILERSRRRRLGADPDQLDILNEDVEDVPEPAF